MHMPMHYGHVHGIYPLEMMSCTSLKQSDGPSPLPPPPSPPPPSPPRWRTARLALARWARELGEIAKDLTWAGEVVGGRVGEVVLEEVDVLTAEAEAWRILVAIADICGQLTGNTTSKDTPGPRLTRRVVQASLSALTPVPPETPGWLLRRIRLLQEVALILTDDLPRRDQPNTKVANPDIRLYVPIWEQPVFLDVVLPGLAYPTPGGENLDVDVYADEERRGSEGRGMWGTLATWSSWWKRG